MTESFEQIKYGIQWCQSIKTAFSIINDDSSEGSTLFLWDALEKNWYLFISIKGKLVLSKILRQRLIDIEDGRLLIRTFTY